ncbi:MAG: molybdate ABC transporter substrate-binding protein [Pseudomonadota bacterium]
MSRRFRPLPQMSRRAALAGLAVATVWPASARAAGPASLTVFAAASLTTVLEELSDRFSRATGHRVAVSPAGSSVLARQIQHGAPADLFISANSDWMDLVEADGLIRPESRVDLLSNRLVLVASAMSARRVDLSDPWDVNDALGSGRLAMALVDAVPAGIYGAEALRSLGLWEGIASRVAQSDNVRAALALVAAGAAPLGLVYYSDAFAEPRVRIVAEIPTDSHPPIVYPAAILTESAAPDAATQFLSYLTSPPARDLFRNAGFEPLPRPT